MRGGVFGVKVLIREEWILLDKVLKDVVSHPPLPLGRPDASIIESLRDALRCRPIDGDSMRRYAAKVLPLQQGRKNARCLIAGLPLADSHAFRLWQAHADSRRREEDQSVHPRPAFVTERALFSDEICEFARLRIGQVEPSAGQSMPRLAGCKDGWLLCQPPRTVDGSAPG